MHENLVRDSDQNTRASGWALTKARHVGKPTVLAGALTPNHSPWTDNSALLSGNATTGIHITCGQRCTGRIAFPCVFPTLGPGHSSGTEYSYPGSLPQFFTVPEPPSPICVPLNTHLPPSLKAFHLDVAPLNPPAELLLSAACKTVTLEGPRDVEGTVIPGLKPLPALQTQGQGQDQPTVGQNKFLADSLEVQYAKTSSSPVFIFQSTMKITYGVQKASQLPSSQPRPSKLGSAFPIPDAPTLDQALIPSFSDFCHPP